MRSILAKIIRHPIVRLVLGIVIFMTLNAVTQIVAFSTAGITENYALAIFFTLVLAIFSCFAYALFVRLLERRPVTELGIKGAAQEWGKGWVLGFILFTLTIGLLWVLGAYHVNGTNPVSVLGPIILISILSSVFEQIVFRGILFRITEEGLGTWMALVISSIIFGAVHHANSNATWFSTLAIAVEAGILLGAAYMFTRRLWLAMGIHFAWNFAQGGIYGVPVSGNPVEGLLNGSLSGPSLLSGDGFGAEATLAALLVSTAAGLYLLWRSIKNNGVIEPFWVRRRKQDTTTNV